MNIRSIRDAAAAVRGRRIDAGLSQAELARRAGVSRKWVYEFEAGKPTAELGLLLRVLEALDLTLELRSGAGSVNATATAPATEGDANTAGTIDLDGLLEEHRGDGR